MAKKLLEMKGLDYAEVNINSEPGLREKIMELTQRRTVPQIFINQKPIGGFDDLYKLDRDNELDQLLNE